MLEFRNMAQPARVSFFTQISWGTIGLCGVLFVSQKNFLFRTLEAIVPSHSFAKTHSLLSVAILLNFVNSIFVCKFVIWHSVLASDF